MMNNVGIENYAFEEKNKWRKKVWSEIASRVKVPSKARVLYLAGEQDLDREIAKKKGFRPYNMIAVEMGKNRTTALRKKGTTTINNNILDVLHNWPEKHKVDVIVADFCFGFEATSIDLYDSLENPALCDAVVIINFQRGRDKSSNPVRKMINEVIGESGVSYRYKNKMEISPNVKHRGFEYLLFHSYETVLASKNQTNGQMIDLENFKNPEHYEQTMKVFSTMQPRFLSYKSNKVFMDSCIFSHVLNNIPENIRKILMVSGRKIFQPLDSEIKKLITAALAVSKKRKNTFELDPRT